MSRFRPPSLRTAVALVIAALLVAGGVAVPALASPAPVSACPPCDDGFVQAAAEHGLETAVAESEATVRVHRNDSATWRVRVVPTDESALNRLAENESLARAVAGDSFGVRYGGGIDHRLLAADVRDGAFLIRYRTSGVVEEGPLGTSLLTYFRDDPGAYIYTDLGADELTVVGPEGTTVARGFGEIDGRRMTATALPDVRDGPFVVFAPAGTPAPGLVGGLAVLGTLAGVVARNLLAFVLVPGGVAVGGLIALRRIAGPARDRDPRRLGAGVAVGGAAVVVATVVAEGDALLGVTGNLLLGVAVGTVPLGLGAAVAVPAARRTLSVRRLLGVSVVLGALVAAGGARAFGGDLHATLALGGALLPAVAALGRADASGSDGTRTVVVLAVALFVALLALAPLTALGGTLFLIGPVLLTLAAVAFVVAAVPLYLLGGASVGPDRPASTPERRTTA
ncbi:hypothetical protein GRX01_01800 [Halobaculum sp. WSA2]|uniref:Uncharacterized protein n=1 Tax=Halobaculum saliterrae TaxID=2073113 RepID=A0A6B0SMG4_9EURY|nr:hypothetical protein [Halobaculum saliterrae]MXR40094.1 hypothetical protein [Halobaculum saliterrae]